MRVFAGGLVFVGACATATSGGDTKKDAPTGGSNDAPLAIDAAPTVDAPPDAPPQPVTLTLSETTSSTVDGTSSFGCNQTTTNYTDANSYFRVFHLADFGVTRPFDVSKVSFGVQQATAGTPATDQPVQVKIGKYSDAGGGTTLTGTTTPVAATSTLRVANGNNQTVDAALAGTFAATDSIIVEIAVPNGVTAKNIFFIGTNTAGEAKPGYISATTCSVSSPTTMASLAAAQSPPLTAPDIVLTVTGTY